MGKKKCLYLLHDHSHGWDFTGGPIGLFESHEAALKEAVRLFKIMANRGCDPFCDFEIEEIEESARQPMVSKNGIKEYRVGERGYCAFTIHEVPLIGTGQRTNPRWPKDLFWR